MSEQAFMLTPGERNNPVWLKLLEYLEHRLESLRIENDRESYDATKTATLRGKIAVYKALIALDKEQPTAE